MYIITEQTKAGPRALPGEKELSKEAAEKRLRDLKRSSDKTLKAVPTYQMAGR